MRLLIFCLFLKLFLRSANSHEIRDRNPSWQFGERSETDSEQSYHNFNTDNRRNQAEQRQQVAEDRQEIKLSPYMILPKKGIENFYCDVIQDGTTLTLTPKLSKKGEITKYWLGRNGTLRRDPPLSHVRLSDYVIEYTLLDSGLLVKDIKQDNKPILCYFTDSRGNLQPTRNNTHSYKSSQEEPVLYIEGLNNMLIPVTMLQSEKMEYYSFGEDKPIHTYSKSPANRTVFEERSSKIYITESVGRTRIIEPALSGGLILFTLNSDGVLMRSPSKHTASVKTVTFELTPSGLLIPVTSHIGVSANILSYEVNNKGDLLPLKTNKYIFETPKHLMQQYLLGSGGLLIPVTIKVTDDSKTIYKFYNYKLYEARSQCKIDKNSYYLIGHDGELVLHSKDTIHLRIFQRYKIKNGNLIPISTDDNDVAIVGRNHQGDRTTPGVESTELVRRPYLIDGSYYVSHDEKELVRIIPEKVCDKSVTTYVLNTAGVLVRVPPDPYIAKGIPFTYVMAEDFILIPTFNPKPDDLWLKFETDEEGNLIPSRDNKNTFVSQAGTKIIYMLGEDGVLFPVTLMKTPDGQTNYYFQGYLIYSTSTKDSILFAVRSPYGSKLAILNEKKVFSHIKSIKPRVTTFKNKLSGLKIGQKAAPFTIQGPNEQNIDIEPAIGSDGSVVMYRLTCSGVFVRYPQLPPSSHAYEITLVLLPSTFVLVPCIAPKPSDFWLSFTTDTSGDLIPSPNGRNTYARAPGCTMFYMLGVNNVLFPVTEHVTSEGEVVYSFQERVVYTTSYKQSLTLSRPVLSAKPIRPRVGYAESEETASGRGFSGRRPTQQDSSEVRSNRRQNDTRLRNKTNNSGETGDRYAQGRQRNTKPPTSRYDPKTYLLTTNKKQDGTEVNRSQQPKQSSVLSFSALQHLEPLLISHRQREFRNGNNQNGDNRENFDRRSQNNNQGRKDHDDNKSRSRYRRSLDHHEEDNRSKRQERPVLYSRAYKPMYRDSDGNYKNANYEEQNRRDEEQPRREEERNIKFNKFAGAEEQKETGRWSGGRRMEDEGSMSAKRPQQTSKTDEEYGRRQHDERWREPVSKNFYDRPGEKRFDDDARQPGKDSMSADNSMKRNGPERFPCFCTNQKKYKFESAECRDDYPDVDCHHGRDSGDRIQNAKLATASDFIYKPSPSQPSLKLRDAEGQDERARRFGNNRGSDFDRPDRQLFDHILTQTVQNAFKTPTIRHFSKCDEEECSGKPVGMFQERRVNEEQKRPRHEESNNDRTGSYEIFDRDYSQDRKIPNKFSRNENLKTYKTEEESGNHYTKEKKTYNGRSGDVDSYEPEKSSKTEEERNRYQLKTKPERAEQNENYPRTSSGDNFSEFRHNKHESDSRNRDRFMSRSRSDQFVDNGSGENQDFNTNYKHDKDRNNFGSKPRQEANYDNDRFADHSSQVAKRKNEFGSFYKEEDNSRMKSDYDYEHPRNSQGKKTLGDAWRHDEPNWGHSDLNPVKYRSKSDDVEDEEVNYDRSRRQKESNVEGRKIFYDNVYPRQMNVTTEKDNKIYQINLLPGEIFKLEECKQGSSGTSKRICKRDVDKKEELEEQEENQSYEEEDGQQCSVMKNPPYFPYINCKSHHVSGDEEELDQSLHQQPSVNVRATNGETISLNLNTTSNNELVYYVQNIKGDLIRHPQQYLTDHLLNKEFSYQLIPEGCLVPVSHAKPSFNIINLVLTQGGNLSPARDNINGVPLFVYFVVSTEGVLIPVQAVIKGNSITFYKNSIGIQTQEIRTNNEFALIGPKNNCTSSECSDKDNVEDRLDVKLNQEDLKILIASKMKELFETERLVKQIKAKLMKQKSSNVQKHKN